MPIHHDLTVGEILATDRTLSVMTWFDGLVEIDELQPAGKKRLAQLRAISQQVEDEFFAPLDPKEREQLHALLLELAAHHDPRYAAGNGN